MLQEISNFARDPQPIALSLLIDSSTSMEPKLAIAQEAAIGFAKRLSQEGRRADHRLRQPDADPPDVHQRRGGARTGDPPDARRRIDVALQRALRRPRRAQTAARSRPIEEVRRQAIVVLSDGEDTSSLEDLRGRARQRQAIGSDRLRDQPQGPRGRDDDAVERGRVRAAHAHAGDRRQVVFRGGRQRSCRRFTARSPTSWPTSTRSATPPRTRSATAPGAASTSR